ncbi:recombinase family protein, partial [Christensenellaceae bacterium OttesenSCG-928-K19]|nr:recombinase family protein [Christensenellaceae bacterium OttesenSCG-928-K19]
FIEKVSGKSASARPELKKMMDYIREGDTVIVESISRFARNTRDLLALVDELKEKGVSFISLKESIDTTTPQGAFMLTIFAALAEFERESILQRQREGVEIAKAQGKYKGRQPIKIDENEFRAVCAEWRAGRITATAAMGKLNLKPNTFYRRVNSIIN